jgi:hypothetical protein
MFPLSLSSILTGPHIFFPCLKQASGFCLSWLPQLSATSISIVASEKYDQQIEGIRQGPYLQNPYEANGDI